jgi:uncharacterized protein YkwD
MTDRISITGKRGVRARSVLVLVLGALLTGLSAGGAAAAEPTFTPDGAASELMRLLNGERTSHGLPALAIDPFLAAQARDGAIDCPNGAGTMAGRAKDMALSGYFDHALRLCTSYNVLNVMPSWGYQGSSGENIAMNGGSGYAPTPYQFGCDVHQANCTGATTQAPATVAKASHQFMNSQGHRDNAMSTRYDRFACGAWLAPNQYAYYACIYADGPGTRTAPPPAGPDVTAPSVMSLTAPKVVTTTNRSVAVTWTATDDHAVTGYAVRTRKGSGAWSADSIQTVAGKSFTPLSPGTWHVGVRARDAAGNWSTLREKEILVPRDDRAWRFSAGNTRRTGTHYINGTDTTTRRAGAKLTIRFTGSSFVLIGTAAKSHGKLRVVIDGKAYTVDEGRYKGSRATSTHYRVTLLSKTLANKAHKVVITCLGTSGRPTIDIDGVAWRD